MSFQVLTSTSMEMTTFSDVAPCSSVEVEQRFGCAYSLHHQSGDDGSRHPVKLRSTSTRLHNPIRESKTAVHLQILYKCISGVDAKGDRRTTIIF